MPSMPNKRSRPPALSYQALDFVMLRAPTLPIENYLALDNSASVADARTATLAPADPCIRRALAIGSPSLLEALDKTEPDDEKAPRLRLKLRRFLVRMSTRPTPYGTFAGVAVCGWGQYTDVSLDGAPRTRTRIDMDWLVQYVLALEAQPNVRNQLRWIGNSAAWILHRRLVLSEGTPLPKGGSRGSLSVAATPMARKALEYSRDPIAYPTLVEKLMASAPSAPQEKIEGLLQQLWQHGFLRTELMPPVTVEDPTQWVRDRLAPIVGGKALRVQLEALLHSIEACDTVPLEEATSAIQRAAAHVAVLGQTQTEMPLQVDMAFALHKDRLSNLIAEEAARMAELLFRLSPVPGGPPIIHAYRQQFQARYGFEREVPLLELLHPEWGLGPPAQSSWGGGIEPEKAARRAETLQRLALDAIRDRQLTVELDEELLHRLGPNELAMDHLPTSVDLNLFVLASSSAAIDAGDFQVMLGSNVGAPTAGRNLARFAHLLGPHVRAALEKSARREEAYHPRHITAEIAYLPRNFRTANVAVRPAIRQYEITHNVSAGIDPDHVIPLRELVVGVREGRFYVRWGTRDVEVLFASGHMLNANQASPECQFLSEITRDGLAQLSSFDWGPANGYPFLPRVQSGRCILQCAQWRLDKLDQEPLDKPDLFASWFARWCERWRVPRRVYLSWMDNRLLYDLNDAAQVEDLRGELRGARGQGQVLLQEALPAPEHAWLPSSSSDGARRIVELVVSLGLREPPAQTAAITLPQQRRQKMPVNSDLRLRPPGSDWLYVKLYGARSKQDELLAGPVRSFCQEMERAQETDNWFFVRYADPDTHIRLRFHGSPERLTGSLLPRLCAWAKGLIEDGQCQKFAIDTYEREVERYGGPEAAAVAETFFGADSRAVTELLSSAPQVDRILLLVLTIDEFLSACFLDDSARLDWLKLTVTWAKEVRDEYRGRRKDIIAALSDPSLLHQPIRDALALYHAESAAATERLVELDASNVLTQPASALYSSYIHMHCNRITSDQTSERRAMGLLLRARDAMAHRGKRSAEPQEASTVEFAHDNS